MLTQTLTLTQTLGVWVLAPPASGEAHFEYVGHSLNITQDAAASIKLVSASNVLTLTQETIYADISYQYATHILDVSSVVEYKRPISVSVTSVITLVDNSRNTIQIGIAANTLVFSQLVSVNIPISAVASNHLAEYLIDVDDFASVGIRQLLNVTTVLNVSAISYLSLSQQAAKITEVSANNHIQLSASTRPVEYEILSDLLLLTQTVIEYVPDFTADDLGIIQTVLATGVHADIGTSTLSLISKVSVFLVNRCGYGLNGDANAPFTTNLAVGSRTGTVLTYPYSAPLHTVTLPSPNRDDVHQFEFRRIIRRSRGGTRQVYRDPSWPKYERLIFSYSYLTAVQAQDLSELLSNSVGKEVGLLDHYNRQWRGLILTPSTPIKEEHRNGTGVSLEFEGTRV